MNIELTNKEKQFNNGIQAEVYSADCYRLKQHQFARTSPIIVDLGANFGWFSRLAAETCPSAKIYAYEMIERNYMIAKHHTTSHLSNIWLHNAVAIGNHRADIIRRDSKSNLGGNKVIVKDSKFYLNNNIDPSTDKFSQSDSGDILQLNLGDILEDNSIDYIDFLKIDIEGSEYDVLEYVFENNLSDRIAHAALEVHGMWDHDENGARIPGESQQYQWLKDQCEKHFDNAVFSGHYAWLSNKREK